MKLNFIMVEEEYHPCYQWGKLKSGVPVVNYFSKHAG